MSNGGRCGLLIALCGPRHRGEEGRGARPSLANLLRLEHALTSVDAAADAQVTSEGASALHHAPQGSVDGAGTDVQSWKRNASLGLVFHTPPGTLCATLPVVHRTILAQHRGCGWVPAREQAACRGEQRDPLSTLYRVQCNAPSVSLCLCHSHTGCGPGYALHLSLPCQQPPTHACCDMAGNRHAPSPASLFALHSLAHAFLCNPIHCSKQRHTAQDSVKNAGGYPGCWHKGGHVWCTSNPVNSGAPLLRTVPPPNFAYNQ